MAATLNLHKVVGGYLQALRVPDADELVLRNAREEIRGTLRGAFADWQTHVARAELYEGGLVAKADEKLPQPKFRRQGSFAYFTVNDVQQNPPQQIDQDDGVFLPVGFLISGGETRPKIASAAYFAIVEHALQPLCTRRGWKLNPNGPKDSCVRVQITARTHIDLPLYAIRDESFNALRESIIRKQHNLAAAGADEAELIEDVYRGLGSSEIMLAHRAEGWKEFDPRRLEAWFAQAVDAFGGQVRRLSRVYKAMRDAEWPDSDLSSICIMAALVTALENLGGQDETRDDIALVNTAREMVDVFRRPIENPVFPGDESKHLCAGWKPDFRERVRALFQRAADEMSAAIHDTMNKQVALDHATTALGGRIPADQSLVTAVGVVNVIRSEPAAPQPRPAPVRTRSG